MNEQPPAAMQTARPSGASSDLPKDDPKTIFGWCMYDWANSGYFTTVAVALLPAYFAGVIAPQGTVIGGMHFSAFALWGSVVAAAALVAFVTAPVLGAISDFSGSGKRFLLAFAYGGSLFTLFLYFTQGGDVWRALLIFLATQICFISANVFYDGFLPHIASDASMDRVSAKGYSYGYVGGGLQFALALVLVALHDRVGISQGVAVRLGIVMAGLWWAGFTVFTWRYVAERPGSAELPQEYRSRSRLLAYVAVGLTRTLQTSRRVGRFRQLLLFLLAYLLYNNGIQTVIEMAAIYGAEELRLSPVHLMITILVIQGIAAVGALFFGWLAARMGTREAIMVTLALWSGVVTYAYVITSATEFFILGAVVGVVLGGSQALSRSFYGSIIPEEASAEFYGFYTVFSKGSAILGPITLVVVRQWLGSARLAILSLIIFFLVGLVLLYFVDEKRARQAKLAGAF